MEAAGKSLSSTSMLHDSPNSADTSRILSGKYLQRSTGKKDLIQRLRNVLEILRVDESIEPDSNEYPALAALCHTLMKFIDHRDKQVRLCTVCCCMELFTVYAPDAPWSTEDTLAIFRQTIRQLANLAHTTSATSPNFVDYARILELLAEVKIGVILVELTKEEENKDEALPVLAELFATLVQSIRSEHPPEIAEMTQATICGCFEEFQDGVMLPIPLLDEVLTCIGQGPKVLTINPQKAASQAQALGKSKKKQLSALQVEQTNPSYIVASAVVRASVDRLSTPVAHLLNGLLNNDPRLVTESSISTHLVKEISKPQTQDQNAHADVYNIIYELHRVAPSILTTVIGTLANFLSVPDVDQRKLVVQLLGKLFVKSPAKFAVQFRPCYRQWLERVQDKDVSIRLLMVNLLLQFVPAVDVEDVCSRAQAALKICLDDPSSEVRLRTIHGLCDSAFKYPVAVALDTWRSVGLKVKSKQKQERKDALTGLVQTYYRHYIVKRLKVVQAGGDDAPLEHVQNALMDPRDERFHWIPSRVFECASWSEDIELQSRVLQAMDDLLLGSELRASSKNMSPTTRAVGLALILDTLEENAFCWLGGILKQRARLQQKVNDYLEARSVFKSEKQGSEEGMAAQAKAEDLLEQFALSTNLSITAGERHPVLKRFHAAKDRHIFRILATIATPLHSTQARIVALDELPKRVKSQGDGVETFVRGLVRRCAMGDFLNLEIVHHCTLLALECGNQGNWNSCRKFLKCLVLAVDCFPDLCGSTDCFQNLKELFAECRSSKDKGIDDIVTTLSVVLAKAAPVASKLNGQIEVDSILQKELLQICRLGSPEQSRHAIQTLIAIHQKNDPNHGSSPRGGKQTPNFLLNSLATPSILSSSSQTTAIISVFVALSELAESMPDVITTARGQRVVEFALESVLLGRGKPLNIAEELIHDKDEQKKPISPPGRRPRRISAQRQHTSPTSSTGFLEDANVSMTCRSLCAAIEFLVSSIRATVFNSGTTFSVPQKLGKATLGISVDLIERVFATLCQVLRDYGMPPSNYDREKCKHLQDRAALRQCAAVHLLRLCDPRLYLDQQFLKPDRWHTLSAAFLDDERVVRDAVMKELGLMLTGNGKYGYNGGKRQAMTPRFNLVALVSLCTDGDHGADRSQANGNAANVGKRASATRMNAFACVSSLRKTFEIASAQARANGFEEELKFEGQMKVRLMPEYVVPYAFHLLAYREETLLDSEFEKTSSRESSEHSNYPGLIESRKRVLKKRLKGLFDPLVLTLGDTADNISFLLRLCEKLSKFKPILESSAGKQDQMSPARLRAVCSCAREVLLSYVKQDSNLDTFPGKIHLPGNLFQKLGTARKRSRQLEIEARYSNKPERTLDTPELDDTDVSSHQHEELVSNSFESLSTRPSKTRRSLRRTIHTSASAEEENFSQEVTQEHAALQANFAKLSPIARKLSVGDQSTGILLSSGEKTRGTTPPSVVRNSSFIDTAPSMLSTDENKVDPRGSHSGVGLQPKRVPNNSQVKIKRVLRSSTRNFQGRVFDEF